MHRWMLALAAAALAFAATGVAHATTQVEVVETFPAGDTLALAPNQTFYLRLRYTSDAPVHIWASPQFDGKEVKAGSNPSRLYPAGSGEALGWFFLLDPGTRVDAVEITAGDGTRRGTPVVASYPVALAAGSSAVAADTPQPAWLTALRATDEAARRAERERAMSAPVRAGDVALFNGFMLTMLAIGLVAFAGPAWGLWRWRGAWRWVAAIPAATMAFVVLRIVVDTTRDPTSHNLWPFEILLWGTLSCAWTVAAAIAHRVTRPRRT